MQVGAAWQVVPDGGDGGTMQEYTLHPTEFLPARNIDSPDWHCNGGWHVVPDGGVVGAFWFMHAEIEQPAEFLPTIT